MKKMDLRNLKKDEYYYSSAFASCQGKFPKSFDEAKNHVDNCLWCKNWIKEHKKIALRMSLSENDKGDIEEYIRNIK